MIDHLRLSACGNRGTDGAALLLYRFGADPRIAASNAGTIIRNDGFGAYPAAAAWQVTGGSAPKGTSRFNP